MITQVFHILQSGWIRHQVTRNTELAKHYESVHMEHRHGVEGDIALELMLKYKSRANALIRLMK